MQSELQGFLTERADDDELGGQTEQDRLRHLDATDKKDS